MTSLNHTLTHIDPHFLAVLGESAEAGIDLAFDADFEELERQFAEMRLTFPHD